MLVNKIAIITSVDYELFGDGTGVVFREQIATTKYLCKLVQPYNVKLTIMFEYAQYLAYEKYAYENCKFSEANAVIREQLIKLVLSGHDVQLHYHAQWHDAIYNAERGEFELNLNTVDISRLEYMEITTILRKGKIFLETLLQPYKKEYVCVAFRAGSWAVKNEEKLCQALIECGFKVDSSVVPNVKFDEGYVSFKYEHCPHRYHYWYLDRQLSKKFTKNKKLIEIPIYTIKDNFAFFKYMNIKSLKLKFLINKLYKHNISRNAMNFFEKVMKKIFRNYYMADINSMTSKTLINMIEQVISDDDFKDEDIIPVMLVGHSKSSYYMNDICLFYDYLNHKYGKNIEYWTLQDFSNSFAMENN